MEHVLQCRDPQATEQFCNLMEELDIWMADVKNGPQDPHYNKISTDGRNGKKTASTVYQRIADRACERCLRQKNKWAGSFSLQVAYP